MNNKQNVLKIQPIFLRRLDKKIDMLRRLIVTFALLIIKNSINSDRKRLLPQNIGLDAKRGDRLTFS